MTSNGQVVASARHSQSTQAWAWHSPNGFEISHHAAVASAAASGSFGRLGVEMFTLRRPRLARAVVTLVIAGAAISSILASAWYYLEDWSFFLILLLLALFGDELLALLLLSGKAENVALTGKEAMIGQIATVVDGFAPAVGLRTVCGKVRLNAELWSAESDRQGREGLAVGRKVRIRSVEGLTLIVEPEQGSKR